MRTTVLSMLGVILVAAVLTIGGVARGASTTSARSVGSPVTIDFESGVQVGAKITNQYGAPSVPAGPTFIDPYPAGISAGCAPPELTNVRGATSGTRAALLTGCASGEFYATGAVVAMGYSVEDVDLRLKGSPNEVFVTGLRANRTIAVQQRGYLPDGGAGFGQVSVHSPSGSDIAYLVIETGTLGNGSSPTGVVQAIGAQLLVLDDLRYTPSSSPPTSSFSLGASPPSQRVGAGDTVTAKIPITWVNNPNPSASPVQLEVAAPPGISASITPNPTTSGTATLTMKVADTATPGATAVVVTGTVDKGTSFEKTAKVSVELFVEKAFDVQILPGPAPTRCTPATWQVRIPLSSTATGNLAIRLDATGAVRITGIDDKPISPAGSVTLSRPATQTGVVSLAVALAALGTGQSGNLIASVGNGTTSTSVVKPVPVAGGSVTAVETVETAKSLAVVSAPMYRRPGTTVRLVGSGFCPGATVQFGKTGGRATPSKVAPDGRSLVVTVPRLAISGPVEVLNEVSGNETAVPSTVTLRVDTFRSRYAYPFDNFKHGTFDISLLAKAYGADAIYLKVDICAAATLGLTSCPALTSIVDPHAFVVWLSVKDSGKKGICYGISSSAGKLANGTWSTAGLPASVPFPSTWQLTGPPGPSPALDRRISAEHLLQASGEAIDAAVAAELYPQSGSSYAGWMRSLALQGLSVGAPMIVTIRDDGVGHAMLVYDLEDLGPGRYRLYLADPNIPFAADDMGNPEQHAANELTSSILVDGPANRWAYPNLEKEEDGKKVPWSDTLSGDSIQIVPKEVAYATKASIPSAFALAKGLVILASDGTRLTQVTDDEGRRLLGDDGDPLRGTGRIPGSATVGPTEADAENGPIAVLTRPVAAEVRATRPAGAGGRLTAMSGSGTIATVAIGASRAPAGGSGITADSLALQPGLAAATFRPGATAAAAITVSTRAGNGAVIAATLSGRTPRGSSDTVSIRDGVATIVHTGPPRSALLTVTTRPRGGLPAVATVPLGMLRADERIQAAIGRSGRPARSIGLRRTVDGRSTVRTVQVRQQRASIAIAATRLVAPKHRVEVRLRVRLRRGATAAGTSVVVLSGRRVVARGVTSVDARSLRRGSGETRWVSRELPPGRYRVVIAASATQSGAGALATTTRTIVVRGR